MDKLMSKKWMIISWKPGAQASEYGRLIAEVEGSYEDAAEEARKWLHMSPVGVVEVIT